MPFPVNTCVPPVYAFPKSVETFKKCTLTSSTTPVYEFETFEKSSPFNQFLRQAQILILKIHNVFLRLKSSPSLNLNKIEHFSKVSIY